VAPLLICQSVSRTYGATPVFDGISLQIGDGDRLGLIGPNGTGKSSLLRILAGIDLPDSGECPLRKNTRLRYVPQDSVFPSGATVGDVLAAACGDPDELDARVATTLGQAGFSDRSQAASALSGGWRKRLAIAEALIAQPSVLLLDEPTNHLDLDGILWLEKLLANARFAMVAVSHDRYFLENVATSVAELNRLYPEGIFRIPGNYTRFLERKAEFLETQAKLEDSLRNKVRREVEWLRRGAKARTTKSKARIDEANRLIGQLDDVQTRQRSSTAAIDFTASDRRTKKLIEAEGLAAFVEGRRLFSGLDLKLAPGVRIGLVGSNGSGKTTLLRILEGSREPDEGSVFRADNLRIVYFDQHRETLDPGVTLERALAPHGDSVIYRGRPIHVAGWAKRFLFRTEQLRVQVGRLSGGERARVQIAKLMLHEADVLLLDEPTNDLDIPTLEVLEESLVEFPGAMVLVTHDRYLLEQVATAVLGIDGEGGAEFFADYSQWEQSQRERKMNSEDKLRAVRPEPDVSTAPRKKLSYIEAREWETIEGRIHQAEARLHELQERLQHPEVVVDGVALQQTYAGMEAAQAEIDRLFARWAELEEKMG
jgi:ATP-binding cassette subfamily F protein uup